jgi:hypothetical protein
MMIYDTSTSSVQVFDLRFLIYDLRFAIYDWGLTTDY